MSKTATNHFPLGLCLAMACASPAWSGCMGAGARVGYRFAVSDEARYTTDVVPEGVYGGPSVDVGFHHGDSDQPQIEKTVYAGVQWAFLFSGPGRHFMTVLPVLGYYNNRDLNPPRRAATALSSLGGYLGAGIEIERRHVGFHSALCGGYFSYAQGYLCARGSTRGWIGFDLNGALAAPTNIHEIFSTLGDGLDGGWYYMG